MDAEDLIRITVDGRICDVGRHVRPPRADAVPRPHAWLRTGALPGLDREHRERDPLAPTSRTPARTGEARALAKDEAALEASGRLDDQALSGARERAGEVLEMPGNVPLPDAGATREIARRRRARAQDRAERLSYGPFRRRHLPPLREITGPGRRWSWIRNTTVVLFPASHYGGAPMDLEVKSYLTRSPIAVEADVPALAALDLMIEPASATCPSSSSTDASTGS
jgi:hypothetical protein